MFASLIENIRSEIVHTIFKVAPVGQMAPSVMEKSSQIIKAPSKVMSEQHQHFSGPQEQPANYDSTITSAKSSETLPGTKTSSVGKLTKMDGQKVGRNDPCPCGAKKSDGTPIKYKKCHGK